MTKKFGKAHFYRTNFFSVNLLGVKVDFLSLKKAVSEVERWVNSNKQYQITTPNPEHIVLAQDDYRFKKIINNSALAIADGVGIVAAARLLSLRVPLDLSLRAQRSNLKFKRLLRRFTPRNDKPQAPRAAEFHRVSGVDLMVALCQQAARKKWRVFLLGGKRAAEIAALKLKAQSSKLKTTTQNSKFNLNISYFDGAVDINNETVKERKEAIKRINNFKPHLLFVAYGAPMQEKWIANNLIKLKVKVAMGVGGAFDYLAGKALRAPKIIQKLNLEWLWRLVHEPWRWKRQLKLAKFVFLVLKEKFF